MDWVTGLAALLQGLGAGSGDGRVARANRLRRQQRLLRGLARDRTVAFPGGIGDGAGGVEGTSVVVTPWALRVVAAGGRVLRQHALTALAVDGRPRRGAGADPTAPDAVTLVGPDGPFEVRSHAEYLGVLVHAVRRAGGADRMDPPNLPGPGGPGT